MGSWGITMREIDYGLDLLGTIVGTQLKAAEFSIFQAMVINPDGDSLGVGVTVYGDWTYCYMIVNNSNSHNPYA